MDWVDDASFGAAKGAAATPNLILEGFSGPLDFLLRLARAHQINLAMLPLQAIVEQLAVALVEAPARMPLGQKADWVVMASWILLLRSNLMLPQEEKGQQEAETEASQLRNRLVALQEVQALAGWLQRRPQLGRDVFSRGVAEWPAQGTAAAQSVDIVGFLWAAMELFDEPKDVVETATRYRPRNLEPYSIAKARERILQRLIEAREAQTLDRLLPDDAQGSPLQSQRQAERRRQSAWSSTFVAALELAKQGDVRLTQDEFLMPVFVDHIAPIA
jgi:segregation and condensation protein A